jgi:hypothetical protein
VIIDDPDFLPSEIDWAPGEAAETIVCVIMELPRLQSYTLRGWDTSQADLLCMLKTTSDLTHLDIYFESDYSGVFPIINRFPRLCWLSLSIVGSQWNHSPEQPITLETLSYVSWTSDSDQDSMVLLLSRCRFSKECRLKVDVPALNPRQARVLDPFFAYHDTTELEINMNISTLCKLTTQISAIPRIVFGGMIPPHTLFYTMPLPESITIYNLHQADHEALWSLLHSLGASTTPLERRTTLNLHQSDEPDFDWLELDSRLAMFVGRLLPLAVALHRRGIVVVDKHGRDVSSLTQPM